MQKFLLIGFVGRDPEMKYTPGGTAITTFSVASTERWKNGGGELQEHTEWFNVKSFGRRAEVAAEFLNQRLISTTVPLRRSLLKTPPKG